MIKDFNSLKAALSIYRIYFYHYEIFLAGIYVQRFTMIVTGNTDAPTS